MKGKDEKMTFIGVKEFTYKNKNTGEPLKGYEFHGTFPSNRSHTGKLCELQFVSARAIENSGGVFPNEGDEVKFIYNRYGKVDSYEIHKR